MQAISKSVLAPLFSEAIYDMNNIYNFKYELIFILTIPVIQQNMS